MIEPDQGRTVYQAWKTNFDNSQLRKGDVLEDILMPRQSSILDERYYQKTWRFRLWRAKIKELNTLYPHTIDFGIPETYVIRPDDERVLEYIKTIYMPYEKELD